MLKDIRQILARIDCKYLLNEPLEKHTSWRVGGPADVVILPKNIHSCLTLLQLLKDHDIPYLILGKGSNILVGDKGYRGAVIKLAELNSIDFKENFVTVGCGVALTVLAAEAAKRSLSGVEFLAGIPGSVGAAVKVNAGADGANISDVFHSALLWHEGIQKEVFLKDMQYAYRQSAFKNTSAVFLMAKLRLTMGDRKTIQHKMQQNITARKTKQPLEYPNAGSIFVNPEGNFAGKLIAEAGLKGKNIGGAAVSQKHANFIINTGHATAKDIKSLILLVQQEVSAVSGITLKPEVEFIGEF